MSRHRSVLFVLVLFLAFPVLAQAQHNRGGAHPGGQMPRPGGVHPGQQGRAGMMSPEEQMMHAWFQQQMMLSQMPRGSRANNGSAHAKPNSSPSSAHQNHAAGKGANGATKPNMPNGAQAGSPGQSQRDSQQNRTNAKHAKADAAKNNRENREKHEEIAKANRLKRANENRSTRGVDNRAVGLLKNAHQKLREADADYHGHRMRSMEHVVSAIHQLESTGGLNGGGGMVGYGGMGGFGSGNMPQGQSDQLLRDALVHLRQTQGMLGTGTTAAEHHRNAHASITEAIHELNTALRIR